MSTRYRSVVSCDHVTSGVHEPDPQVSLGERSRFRPTSGFSSWSRIAWDADQQRAFLSHAYREVVRKRLKRADHVLPAREAPEQGAPNALEVQTLSPK